MQGYFSLGLIGGVLAFSRTQWGLACGVRAAVSIHDQAYRRVLLAPMAFFDTTPLGRLLVSFKGVRCAGAAGV